MSTRSGPIDERLAAVRTDPSQQRWLVAVGALVGLSLATIHRVGFVVGGALVALPQSSVRRGLLAGFAFGAFAWLIFLGWLARNWTLGTCPTLGELMALSTAISILGGLLGGLARSVL